jgi:hypothetical protein
MYTCSYLSGGPDHTFWLRNQGKRLYQIAELVVVLVVARDLHGQAAGQILW